VSGLNRVIEVSYPLFSGTHNLAFVVMERKATYTELI
jgi:hypothetical protein